MSSYYLIDGNRVPIKTSINCSAEERNSLVENSRVELSRRVQWPLEYGNPNFSKAYEDPGETEIWGAGPYLKVPFDDGAQCRVFCPWGYPPRRIRINRHKTQMQMNKVELVRENDHWLWILHFQNAT